MSKEYLEAFEVITGDNYHCDEETFYHNKAIVEQALQRLESIDNAEPSEALEIVDKMANYILLDEEYGFIDDKEKQSIIKDRDTIKQALLKQQEPKKYLKWEDLEFKEEEQTMKVKLNNKIYTMFYCSDEVCFDTVSIAGVFIDSCSQQFFNDLHLERVEE